MNNNGMKKILLSSVIAMAACLFACSCSAKDIIVKVQDLPQIVQSFLAAHFSNTDVAVAIKDGHEYEIRMDNGWEMEFDIKDSGKRLTASAMKFPPA